MHDCSLMVLAFSLSCPLYVVLLLLKLLLALLKWNLSDLSTTTRQEWGRRESGGRATIYNKN
jgi:hypothetical protein